jgi:hypothetical protein
MDINPQTTKPMSDDQELAKVLAGVNQQNDEPLQFDSPPVMTPPAPITPPIVPAPSAPVVVPQIPSPAPVLPTPSPVSTNGDDLESIKKDALKELRPLVDKLDLAPEEKFDTYLLLLRSTDDKTLIAPAHIARLKPYWISSKKLIISATPQPTIRNYKIDSCISFLVDSVAFRVRLAAS